MQTQKATKRKKLNGFSSVKVSGRIFENYSVKFATFPFKLNSQTTETITNTCYVHLKMTENSKTVFHSMAIRASSAST